MASNVLNPVILLLLLVSSVSDAKVFLSIDCGASAVYTDDRNISWSLDAPYITTGESFQVSSTGTSTTDTELNTLRVFKTSPKSCYSINVEKGEQVLVRASFSYGNYDNNYVPPTFDVQLNGKYWGTVVGDISTYSTYEAIIVADNNVINVCLVRTFAGQYPFISALELRSLDPNMYSRTDSVRALYLATREIGSNLLTVRYPDDIYDRIWSTTSLFPTSSSDTLQTINITLEDNPPVAALQGAVTSYLTSVPVAFQLLTSLPQTQVPVLVNMYFAELDKLDVSDKRSFNVYIDSRRLTSTPITPRYGIASEMTFTNISASSATTFSLTATDDSTLPPILNALEIYTFSGDSDSNSNNGTGGNGDDSNSNNGSGGNGDDSKSNNDPTISGSSTKKKGKKTGVIVGSTVPIFILISGGGIVLWQRKRKTAIPAAIS